MIQKNRLVLAMLLTIPGGMAIAQTSPPAPMVNPDGTVMQPPMKANPNHPGATGEAIVKGDSSTIAGDRKATNEQKTETINK